jgi:hypothetical protein
MLRAKKRHETWLDTEVDPEETLAGPVPLHRSCQAGNSHKHLQ